MPPRKANGARRPADAIDLDTLPGYFIRRQQQIAVAIFLEEAERQALTPVQFAALLTVARQPELDQRSLAATIGLDTSTVASVIDRLEARDLMRRQPSLEDRRLRLLTATPEGLALLDEAEPGVLRAQERILAPLSPTEKQTFLKLLMKLVQGNNGYSRAPSASSDRSPVED
jgi:DNA-binding MarR family transcriptional regulator